jgi:hypothetical protein
MGGKVLLQEKAFKDQQALIFKQIPEFEGLYKNGRKK